MLVCGYVDALWWWWGVGGAREESQGPSAVHYKTGIPQILLERQMKKNPKGNILFGLCPRSLFWLSCLI